MNKDRLLRWAKLLESGNYQQGKQALHIKTPEGEKFCCIGVACVVAIEDGLPLRVVIDQQFVRYTDDLGAHGEWGPLSLAEYFGLEIRGFGTARYSVLKTYAQLNDQGLTFAEIAQHIRHDFDLPQ